MKLMNFYMSCYYRFFLLRNPDKSWAITRSAGVLTINLHLLLINFFILIFSLTQRNKSLFDEFYDRNKALIQIGIVLYSFAVQYLISRYFKAIVRSNSEIVEIGTLSRWIAWLTLPLLLLIFFFQMSA